MKVYVNVKQAGSRKNYIARQEIILNSKPSNLRELIGEIVTKNVEDYNDRIEKGTLINYLTSREIENKISTGKVYFGEIYNNNKPDLTKALEAAFLAYEDGIYRVFIGDKEAGLLDEALQLEDGDVLTFIRLTMLAGRMW